ncbi:HD domain-containing protein [Mycena floridula]|nr:HD domain-containing protein [Mycena floridula]
MERVFPPLYVPTGKQSVDRLAFFHIIERLKTQKRTGWIHQSIPEPESISDHMHRMSLLSLCCSDSELDISKCVMISVVHDLAEAQVGDIAPAEGIRKPEKRRLEEEAMQNFVHGMLHGSPAALRIEALWKEYEEGQTKEAQLVKDLDRFEMACQALEYEKRHDDKDLQGFFDSSLPYIRHPEVKAWAQDLLQERETMRNTRNKESS